jgi:uncharacterized secreted protein with C-terminal beta-propeller domain
MKKEVSILALLVVLVVVLIGIYTISPQPVADNKLKKFSSCEELKNFVKSNVESYNYGWGGGVFSTVMTGTAPAMAQKATAGMAEEAVSSEDYSKTNIQVEGVDEADIVKNDGKYIYTVSGNKLVIIDAFPAENAKVLSEIELSGTPQEIFINKDKLVVFGQSSRNYEGEYYPYYYGTFINVYDVSDRSNPVLKRNFSLEGNYFDSRMIGNYVYVILNQNYYLKEGGEIPPMPNITSGSQTKQLCGCADVYYFDSPDYSYMFTTILSLNTQNDNEDITSKVFLMGTTQNIFVSLNNIYVTYTKYMSQTYYTEKLINDVYIPSVPAIIASRINEIKNSMNNSYERLQAMGEVVQNYSGSLSEQERTDFEKAVQERMIKYQSDIAKETEKTVVHKISIKDGKIEYKNQGEVPGNVLNQFSMDEYNNYFRIATTSGHVSRGVATSANHVYVLSENLAIVGKLEDLAPGERIYSARFIGDRCYLVTFKKIDPLFVIDLKDPFNPKILGKLKIPGYSDYLHPYDENHIIGIGKETVEAEEGGNFAWYQGIKISLFDVSDVEHPKEVSKYNIGDRGTDSYALHDHKAFLFSKSKNLLVIPILLAEIDEEKYPGGVEPNTYGEYVWQGAYVFDLTLENGFVLKGRITHLENESELIKSGYYYSSPYDVKRSLYMDDALYTVSDKMIKMNNLDNMNEINKIQLPYEQQEGYYPYWR